jgi:hypothetical protein
MKKHCFESLLSKKMGNKKNDAILIHKDIKFLIVSIGRTKACGERSWHEFGAILSYVHFVLDS